MMTRTREKTWTFGKPFMLKGVDRVLPAGSYRVATDEELIEGLSFPVYRRVATMIFAPGRNRASLEMLTHRSGGLAGRAGARCCGARDVKPAPERHRATELAPVC